MRKVHSFCVVLGFAAFATGCDHPEPPEMGEVRTQKRDIGDFDSIEMRGDARMEISVGENAGLTIEGREGVIRHISTEIHGDTLRIRTKRRDWLWTEGDPRVTLRITVPNLDSLNLRGGNEVRLSGFEGGDSTIKVEGAASIKAEGRLDELNVHVAGAGHADFSKLVATDAKVTVDGVGSVYVNSQGSLDATMNGVGAIYYTGNPNKLNTSMNGFGTIARKDAEERKDSDPDEQEIEPEIDPDKLQPEYEKPSPALEKLKNIEPTETI